MDSIDHDRDLPAEAAVSAIQQQRSVVKRLLADAIGAAGPCSHESAEAVAHFWRIAILPGKAEVEAIIDEHVRASHGGAR